ncbi:BQ2448_3654 [Microbotryum intermedium]|uniref:BQ2448_3654 protein n=1 Tax=Microbotryum intermedium TaxID=269621 RepID=A0A238FAM0_9BASI|nr:BQ2448_3654 [Microbotryum intermedium]
MRISLASLLLITFYVSTTLFGVALSDTQCGLNCATQITAVTACQNTNNRTCMCQDYDYATKYRGCIQRACLQNDLLAVFKADGAACAALGIEMTQPAPGLDLDLFIVFSLEPKKVVQPNGNLIRMSDTSSRIRSYESASPFAS